MFDVFDTYEAKEWLREKVNDFLLWSVQKINQHKNECLAQRLHDLSVTYRRRPMEHVHEHAWEKIKKRFKV